MKYYVSVELRDYSGKLIGEHSCNCDTDISTESIVSSARVAAQMMAEHSVNVKLEQKKAIQGK